jgi:hypothetical protein
MVNMSDRESGLLNCTLPLSREESKRFITQSPPGGIFGGYYDKSKAYVSLHLQPIDEEKTRVTVTVRIETVVHGILGESLESTYGRLDLNSNGEIERRVLDTISSAVGSGAQ